MTMTKAEAFASASQRLGAAASVDQIIQAADKMLAYINGTPTVAAAAPVVAPPAPKLRKIPATYYVAEYMNRADNGTHLGKKHYKTYNGAAKNRYVQRVNNTERRSRSSRFVRVVKLQEAV